jgi:hypothetical protein
MQKYPYLISTIPPKNQQKITQTLPKLWNNKNSSDINLPDYQTRSPTSFQPTDPPKSPRDNYKL